LSVVPDTTQLHPLLRARDSTARIKRSYRSSPQCFRSTPTGKISGIARVPRSNYTGESNRECFPESKPPVTTIEFRNPALSKNVSRWSSVSISTTSSSCPSTSRILYIGCLQDRCCCRYRVASQCDLLNDTAMIIRDAVFEDAPAACQTMRRSITELCAADHNNDPAVLQRWLSNKTPETFRTWIKPGNSVLVAIEGGDVIAAGCVTDAGEITLNYVSPDARFRGVSSALLSALERRAMERGNTQCTLESTETARRFYHARGYSENGPAGAKFGTTGGYPMTKRLEIT
jgi:GNAT superfamily N-acetyltransferase